MGLQAWLATIADKVDATLSGSDQQATAGG